MKSRISIVPIFGIPRVTEGENIGAIILDALVKNNIRMRNFDIIVVTQKIVSKAEGRMVKLDSVRPSKRAKQISRKLQKDPRLIHLILSESKRIVRMGHGVLITETRHGFVCANSGVDQSNVEKGYVTLLSVNPDRSSRKIMSYLRDKTGKRIAVIITDTFGRPWREGQTDVSIGCSGLKPIRSYKGVVDPYGYELKVTEPAVADEIASAAELVMGKVSNVPVALVRGFSYEAGEEGIKSIIRPREKDLFR